MEFKVGDKVRFTKDLEEFIVKNTTSMKRKLENSNVLTVKSVNEQYKQVTLEELSMPFSMFCFEKVEEEPKPIHDEIYLSYIGDVTVAVHEKTGVAVRSKHDKEDRKIGILIAVMRAVGFEEEVVSKVIDVLFDDIKDIKDYSTEELLKEIMNRVK